MLQIQSIQTPLDAPEMMAPALQAFARADAMGLLPAQVPIARLDQTAVRQLLRHVQKAGIGRHLLPECGLGALLEQLNLVLEESPVPATEWPRMTEMLGIPLLARLLHLSPSSLRRYKDQARSTPDEVAARLHFVSLITGDLSGAYNEFGIRQWFGRKRAQLDDRAPMDWLPRGWTPVQPGPGRVRGLARALTSSPAT